MTEDITSRLRRWVYSSRAESCCDIMDEAADEIDKLRREIDRLNGEDGVRDQDGHLAPNIVSSLRLMTLPEPGDRRTVELAAREIEYLRGEEKYWRELHDAAFSAYLARKERDAK